MKQHLLRTAAWALAGFLLLPPLPAHTAEVKPPAGLTYALTPVEIAPNSYLVEGSTDDFSPANGGFIVNAAFIGTSAGTVLIDTGPSALFGSELRIQAEAITGQPVTQVLITHEHPDHFLGNQAFDRPSLSATAGTIRGIAARGDDYTTNMYRLLGDWMRGTDTVVPETVVSESVITVGDHRLRLIPLRGHTESDLVIFDETTGVLYASDLVFHNRAPTTPQASIASWLVALEHLKTIPFTVIVPGHGPASKTDAPIAQTQDWLRWLDHTLRTAASQGLSPAEVMALPIPERFQALSLARSEFMRSVVHLYPAIAKETLLPPSATKVE